jgi:hypothetical protein
MTTSEQKRALIPYLDGIAKILREQNLIKQTPYKFKTNWTIIDYSYGFSPLGIDILYCLATNNEERFAGLCKRLKIDFHGDIVRFLNTDYISGKVNEPKNGIKKLTWIMLEKMRDNKMDYFQDIKKKLQEKSL